MLNSSAEQKKPSRPTKRDPKKEALRKRQQAKRKHLADPAKEALRKREQRKRRGA